MQETIVEFKSKSLDSGISEQKKHFPPIDQNIFMEILNSLVVYLPTITAKH